MLLRKSKYIEKDFPSQCCSTPLFLCNSLLMHASHVLLNDRMNIDKELNIVKLVDDPSTIDIILEEAKCQNNRFCIL